jgi:hypothetical protein
MRKAEIPELRGGKSDSVRCMCSEVVRSGTLFGNPDTSPKVAHRACMS